MQHLVWILSVIVGLAWADHKHRANRSSWGHYDIHTNYYEVVPDTGRTVEVSALEYEFYIVLVDSG